MTDTEPSEKSLREAEELHGQLANAPLSRPMSGYQERVLIALALDRAWKRGFDDAELGFNLKRIMEQRNGPATA